MSFQILISRRIYELMSVLTQSLNFGSPTIQMHLVDNNTSLKPTIAKRDSLAKRSWWSWFWGLFDHSTFDNVKTKGILAEFDYVPRNSNDPVSRVFWSLFLASFS